MWAIGMVLAAMSNTVHIQHLRGDTLLRHASIQDR